MYIECHNNACLDSIGVTFDRNWVASAISSMLEIHNKVISGFKALRQAGTPIAGARTRDRRVPADLRGESPATVPPTPPQRREMISKVNDAIMR
ncbi:hypothetical protein PoB_002838000 [Plakobranchus ocellatus]|uniref:Uncharacterized protein n=1 Tax=Plakobranchus ocellatus TaxID=259542 RepID=A0AAV4A4S8_9GAST|nr:hypothetical protein PoB_002838000 [Plakobranchus ocellatus]